MIETVQKTTLPNGVRVVTESIDYVQSISLGIWVATGARFEEESRRGISHFLEHMLFKGTERRPTAKQIADEIENVGGGLNAFTDKEYTSITPAPCPSTCHLQWIFCRICTVILCSQRKKLLSSEPSY